MSLGAGFYGFQGISASIEGPGGFSDLGNGSGASSDGLTLEPISDQSTVEFGADGYPTHSLSASTGHIITARFSQVAPVNRILTVMANIQQVNPRLNGINVITIRDVHNGDLILCELVSFSKVPVITYASIGGNFEWEFIAGRVQRTLGGL